MKIKKILAVMTLTGVMIGCSSPQKIILNNDNIIETRDSVKYDKKTGFYKYEDIDGNEGQVNSNEVKIIKEM